MVFNQFGKIYIGSSLYLDGNVVANAIGDEALGLLRDVTSLVNTIITSIPDSTHFAVESTAGMHVGDTLIQGTDPLRQHLTLISNVVDSTHLQVGSTSGFTTATTYTDLANRIIFDKTTLASTLTSFGVPSSPGEELIALVDKVAPLNINFIVFPPPEHFPAPVVTSIVTGPSDITTFLATEMITSESETFTSPVLTDFDFDGNFLSGGEAMDTTHPVNFTILNTDATYSPPRMFVSTTSGMQIGDTIAQGLTNTTIVAILNSTNLSVNSVVGFNTDTVLTTFTG